MHDSKQYAEMETGDTTFAFADDELAALNVPVKYRKNLSNEMPGGIEVVLVSPDIDAA